MFYTPEDKILSETNHKNQYHKNTHLHKSIGRKNIMTTKNIEKLEIIWHILKIGNSKIENGSQ